MALPLYDVNDDPGPNFLALLEREGAPNANGLAPHAVTQAHATTVLAVRFAEGVVMAGDRRATAGVSIAHRSMEKVFPADRHSAVAISGSAGMAVEMVRLFQVQLEHYEKVEGAALSLEGKANQLAQMVRAHLPMAVQGFAVVPLFCGYDLSRQTGRIFDYDAAGGHYEEFDFQTTGSGGRDARQTIKLGYRENLSRDEALDLASLALYEAAEADAATGGPDLVRGIYPIMTTVTADGYERVTDAEVASLYETVIARRRERRGDAGGTLR